MSWLASSGVVDKWKALGEKKDAIPAAEFAEAALALITVFDLIPGVGKIAGPDMAGNANTVKKLEAGKTLQALVEEECAGKEDGDVKKIAGNGKTATCALLWLTRALYFILKMLEPLVNEPQKKMSECVLAGYEVSLKPHHNWMLSKTFSVATAAAPTRDAFLAKLAPTEAEVKSKIDEVAPVVALLLDSIKDKLLSLPSGDKYLKAY